jgi:hypothetical protein
LGSLGTHLLNTRQVPRGEEDDPSRSKPKDPKSNKTPVTSTTPATNHNITPTSLSDQSKSPRLPRGKENRPPGGSDKSQSSTVPSVVAAENAPEWFKAATTALLDIPLTKEWQICVESWMELEKSLMYGVGERQVRYMLSLIVI